MRCGGCPMACARAWRGFPAAHEEVCLSFRSRMLAVVIVNSMSMQYCQQSLPDPGLASAEMKPMAGLQPSMPRPDHDLCPSLRSHAIRQPYALRAGQTDSLAPPEMYEPNPLFGGVRKALGLGGGASRVSAASKALADAQMQQFLTGRLPVEPEEASPRSAHIVFSAWRG